MHVYLSKIDKHIDCFINLDLTSDCITVFKDCEGVCGAGREGSRAKRE